MKYELAKELKIAGWPQGNSYMVWCEGDFIPRRNIIIESAESDISDVPTLSELIEACGGGFVSLTKMGINHSGSWRAESDQITFYDGSTPEEAVARLWLVLNAKPQE